MTGYEYGNTRLRVMRKRLIGRDELLTMLAAASLERMLAMLSDTQYGPDVEASLVRARGLKRLDDAIRSNLARTLGQMASFYEDRAREKVDLLLHRWDLHNLRALVRLPQSHLEPGDVAGLLVPAGRLTENELNEIAAQPDLRSRIDLIVAWDIPTSSTARLLVRARSEYEISGEIAVLEAAVDRAFAAEVAEVLDEDGNGSSAILRAEIELRNLSAALRRRASRMDQEPGWSEPSGGYVEGGLVPTEVWEQVADTNQAEAVVDLVTGRKLPYEWDIALREWVTHGDLATLADQLRSATTTAALARLVTGDVLGFDVPVAFTFAKEAEVRNLHLVGRGIVHDIPAGEIEARLEMVA